MSNVSKHKEPTYDNNNEEVRKLQMIEAKKHSKFDTMEQARLDAIARIVNNAPENPEKVPYGMNIQKAASKMVESIKMDRAPEFDANMNVRKLQETHYSTHKKINTMEQGRLDAMARLATNTNAYSASALESMQSAILRQEKPSPEHDDATKIQLLESEISSLRQTVQELKQSKIQLILNTSAEIEKLRNALRPHNHC